MTTITPTDVRYGWYSSSIADKRGYAIYKKTKSGDKVTIVTYVSESDTINPHGEKITDAFCVGRVFDFVRDIKPPHSPQPYWGTYPHIESSLEKMTWERK
jgi:hypothetical protein